MHNCRIYGEKTEAGNSYFINIRNENTLASWICDIEK